MAMMFVPQNYGKDFAEGATSMANIVMGVQKMKSDAIRADREMAIKEGEFEIAKTQAGYAATEWKNKQTAQQMREMLVTANSGTDGQVMDSYKGAMMGQKRPDTVGPPNVQNSAVMALTKMRAKTTGNTGVPDLTPEETNALDNVTKEIPWLTNDKMRRIQSAKLDFFQDALVGAAQGDPKQMNIVKELINSKVLSDSFGENPSGSARAADGSTVDSSLVASKTLEDVRMLPDGRIVLVKKVKLKDGHEYLAPATVDGSAADDAKLVTITPDDIVDRVEAQRALIAYADAKLAGIDPKHFDAVDARNRNKQAFQMVKGIEDSVMNDPKKLTMRIAEIVAQTGSDPKSVQSLVDMAKETQGHHFKLEQLKEENKLRMEADAARITAEGDKQVDVATRTLPLKKEEIAAQGAETRKTQAAGQDSAFKTYVKQKQYDEGNFKSKQGQAKLIIEYAQNLLKNDTEIAKANQLSGAVHTPMTSAEAEATATALVRRIYGAPNDAPAAAVGATPTAGALPGAAPAGAMKKPTGVTAPLSQFDNKGTGAPAAKPAPAMAPAPAEKPKQAATDSEHKSTMLTAKQVASQKAAGAAEKLVPLEARMAQIEKDINEHPTDLKKYFAEKQRLAAQIRTLKGSMESYRQQAK